MSWELIAVSPSGNYEHWIDEYGNPKYKKVKGNVNEFSNEEAWNRSLGATGGEPIPVDRDEPEDDEIDVPPPRLWLHKDLDSETDTYLNFQMWFIAENAIPITIYPIRERIEQLADELVKHQDYHLYRLAFKYTVVKEYGQDETGVLGTVIYPVGKGIVGYDSFDIDDILIDFESKYDQLINLQDSYKKVLIHQTRIEVRDLPNP